MAAISLAGGHTLIVDDEDLSRLGAKRWAAQKGHGTFYAARVDNGRKVYAHRLIVAATPGARVDHRNGNGLDCRRQNLRFCSNVQNMRNMHGRRGASRFKGVAWFKRDKCWRAYITVDGRQKHLGYFSDERAAAQAYDRAAGEMFGAFANVNLPPMGVA